MTNMLRNKLPRLALLLALAASNATFNTQNSQADLAARANDEAQALASAEKATRAKAQEIASAAEAEGAIYAAAPAPGDALVAASDAAPVEGGSAAEGGAREANAIQCAAGVAANADASTSSA